MSNTSRPPLHQLRKHVAIHRDAHGIAVQRCIGNQDQGNGVMLRRIAGGKKRGPPIRGPVLGVLDVSDLGEEQYADGNDHHSQRTGEPALNLSVAIACHGHLHTMMESCR